MNSTLPLHIDARTNKIVDQYPLGLTGSISWARLASEVFPRSGEISPAEVVTHLTITEGGITFVGVNIPK
jgi:hypothetical protein